VDVVVTRTYRVVRWWLRWLVRHVLRAHIEGAEVVPLTGPVLLAPNHRSLVDFVIPFVLTERKIFFMIQDGMFVHRMMAHVLGRMGGIPVARGKPDRSSVESCKAVLAAGQVLALYPEGRLGTGPLVGPLSDGAVFIAASTQATIVPVGVAGLERFRSIRGLWRPDTVRVVVGQSLAMPVTIERPRRSWVTAQTGVLQEAMTDSYRRAQVLQTR
jgi:1-acyl-sn-glycerol-3-phosphate acyltransferase